MTNYGKPNQQHYGKLKSVNLWQEWPWVLPVLSPCHSCPPGNEAVQSTCSWYNSAANNSSVYTDGNWTRRTNFRVHNMGSFLTVYRLKTETIKPRQFIHSVLRCWQNTQQETFQTKAQGKHQQDLCQGCENTTPQAWAGTQWLWQHHGWLQEHVGFLFQRGFLKQITY